LILAIVHKFHSRTEEEFRKAVTNAIVEMENSKSWEDELTKINDVNIKEENIECHDS